VLDSVKQSATKATTSSRRCVSILTGYPRADRRRYVTRLLNQVDQLHGLGASSQYDIRVYCDGDCGSLAAQFPDVTFRGPSANRSSVDGDGRPLLRRLDAANETVEPEFGSEILLSIPTSTQLIFYFILDFDYCVLN